jgi:uncharacterized protein DUF6282
VSTKVSQANFSAILDEVVRGSSDMHVHFGSDVRPEGLGFAPRMDALETARSAEAAGMRAIVLKSHYWPTGGLAQALQPLVPGTKMFGMVVMNYQNGDRHNPFAAEVGALLGCKIIMAPSMHAAPGVRAARADGRAVFGVRADQGGLSVVGDDGNLLPEVEVILDIAQQYDMVVASGHLGAPDDRALVAGACRRNLTTILTHVRPDPDLLEERRWMIAHGAIIEWNGNPVHRLPVNVPLTIEHARAVGIENSCLTTDSGQAIKPPVAECLRMFVAQLILGGMSVEEVTTMAQSVPARVLGLDATIPRNS